MIETEDKNNKSSTNFQLVLLIILIALSTLNFLKEGTSEDTPRVLVLGSDTQNKSEIEKGICEAAISSFKNGECIWGVMDEDTCYELENNDDLVSTPARFKVLHSIVMGNKCKVFARDHKDLEGKILRAFSVSFIHDEIKLPWLYQVVDIQELFVTEKEKKKFDI